MRVQIATKGDPLVPPYYLGLRPDGERSVMGFKGSRHPFIVKDRWEIFSLLVLQSKAKQTEFLNVLIPYEKQAPLNRTPMGENGVKLAGADTTVLVAGGGDRNSALAVDGGFGVARLDKGNLTSYALHHGHGLTMGTQELVRVKLVSEAWAPFFDSAVTVAVSLPDRRASINIAANPMDRGLIMFSPKIEEGKEPPLPIQVSVSFKADEKPRRIIAIYSVTEMPALTDPGFERKIAPVWNPDYHSRFYKRETPDFTWNEQAKTISVVLDYGIRQLVWE